MANKFGRYVWLIEQFRQYGRLTFEEISRHWVDSGLSYEEPLPKRTFHNHRAAILDIFQVDIFYVTPRMVTATTLTIPRSWSRTTCAAGS